MQIYAEDTIACRIYARLNRATSRYFWPTVWPDTYKPALSHKRHNHKYICFKARFARWPNDWLRIARNALAGNDRLARWPNDECRRKVNWDLFAPSLTPDTVGKRSAGAAVNTNTNTEAYMRPPMQGKWCGRWFWVWLMNIHAPTQSCCTCDMVEHKSEIHSLLVCFGI